ncbi:unnamed protein product [Cylindrotheca closterium]|uniref:Subtilisin n=1 Tax=Cylindrotheca closterium TaxID=2856 RepID=A0AAD2CBU2_9STRA|nr:unnamed protein product [Cylindrotheca closterium]
MKTTSVVALYLSSTVITTVNATKNVDRAFRMEFLQNMEEATRQKNQFSYINARKLFTAATPMSAPEFMKPRILDQVEEEARDDAVEDDGATNDIDGDDATGDDAAGDDGDQEANQIVYSINLENYALKYIGCSNIHTYSSELAEDNAGSVLEMNRFITLRLCPKDECSNYYKLGCSSGYGDYLITMGDYLEIMSETYFKQYVEYCQTCEACLYPDSKHNKTDSNNGYYGWNEYATDGNSGGNCRYSGVCSKYRAACKDYSEQTYHLEEYFECSPVSMGDSYVYLGPHCGSDGKSLGIGVYSDEYCNEYTKDLTEISSYFGMDIDDGYMKPFHSNNCISCVASEGYVLDANQAGDGINDVCYDIYGAAAKCNKYMGLDEDANSEVQEANEESVCTFIHNVMTNSYDEFGEIYLGRGGIGSYIRAAATVDGSQRHVLVFSMLLVSGLGAYAAYLHRMVCRSKYPWLPRRGYSTDPKSDPAMLGRDHSGILSGRSFEKGAYA